MPIQQQQWQKDDNNNQFNCQFDYLAVANVLYTHIQRVYETRKENKPKKYHSFTIDVNINHKSYHYNRGSERDITYTIYISTQHVCSFIHSLTRSLTSLCQLWPTQ